MCTVTGVLLARSSVTVKIFARALSASSMVMAPVW
jgi:hypothetical protein